MGVVARLDVHAVEHAKWGLTYKMQPVVSGDDEHDEEIKQFFAATPAGSVSLWTPLSEPLGLEPGDQTYLYLDAERAAGSLDDVFFVKSIRLDGWATYVEFASKPVKRDGITYSNSSIMSFTIRNEAAAEQFQPAAEFYVRLEKVSG